MSGMLSPFALYDGPPPAGVPPLDIDPFSPGFLDNPWPGLREMREAGPVVWLEQYNVAAVARYEEARSVLSNWQAFSSARGVGMEDFVRHGRFRLPSLILEADPPEHSKARGVLSRVLSPPVLKGLRTGFEEKAETLIRRLAARRRFDAIGELAEAFPLSVFPDAMGLPQDGRDKLLPHAEMLFNSFGPRNALFEQSVHQASFDWVEHLGQRETLGPGLGLLIHEAADKADVSRDDAPKLVRALIQAGLDTTVHAIGASLYCLARFPDQWDRLRASPELAASAFNEAIRYESPVQTFFRTTIGDQSLSGAQLHDGDKVLVFLGSANHDPAQWASPDIYDIGRDTIGHLGFGAGIHRCVGQLLARMEGEIVLTVLARHARTLKLAGEPVRRINNTLRGLASLPVEIEPA